MYIGKFEPCCCMNTFLWKKKFPTYESELILFEATPSVGLQMAAVVCTLVVPSIH